MWPGTSPSSHGDILRCHDDERGAGGQAGERVLPSASLTVELLRPNGRVRKGAFVVESPTVPDMPGMKSSGPNGDTLQAERIIASNMNAAPPSDELRAAFQACSYIPLRAPGRAGRQPARSESVHDDLKDRPQRVTRPSVTNFVLDAPLHRHRTQAARAQLDRIEPGAKET